MTTYVLLALLVWALFVGRPKFARWSVAFWLWDSPVNGMSIWFDRRNLRRFEIGGTIFRTPAERRAIASTPWAHKRYSSTTFWWAVIGFSGTVHIHSFPGYGFVRDLRWRRFWREQAR